MLPKRRKVGTPLLSTVLKKGRTVSSQYFSLKFATPPNIRESKFSIVISGKVSKKAVDRNLLRRRGYVAVAKNKRIKTLQPVAGVFFAKKGAAGLSYKKIEDEFNGLLERIGSQKKT